MKSDFHSEDGILGKEARLFTRYLIDRESPEEMVERYIKANRKLGIDVEPPTEVTILKFLRSHPWSVPFLDAAAGLIQPDALIRKKIYTMAAVLETSTLYTGEFLPRPLSPPALFFHLLTNGMLSVIKMIIGVPLLFFIRRRRND